jgi:hypothetical protein
MLHCSALQQHDPWSRCCSEAAFFLERGFDEIPVPAGQRDRKRRALKRLGELQEEVRSFTTATRDER